MGWFSLNLIQNAFFLDAEGPVALELPNQWLWNIIDEFIYQFQAFSQFRCKLSKKVTHTITLVYWFCYINGMYNTSSPTSNLQHIITYHTHKMKAIGINEVCKN